MEGKRTELEFVDEMLDKLEDVKMRKKGIQENICKI
jgi:hypothetical protein